jgi:hypothetical protein
MCYFSFKFIFTKIIYSYLHPIIFKIIYKWKKNIFNLNYRKKNMQIVWSLIDIKMHQSNCYHH